VQPNDLLQFLTAIIEEFKDLSTQKQLTLQVQDAEIYQCVWFDANVLEKIILNLLNNSYKYTGDNGLIVVTVFSSLDGFIPSFANELIIKEPNRASHYFYIRIADNGIGISKDSIVHLFERYYRVRSTDAPSSATQSDHRESILFVDDNAELRQFLSDTLKAKYQIYEAEDGNAGFEMARQISPDLIISDVMMPGINGIEFCKRIKNDFETSHIPFVMLTGRDSLEAKLEGVGSGADVYLSKPISVDLLALTIRNILEQKRKSKERYLNDYYAEARGLVSSEKDKALLDKLYETLEEHLTNSDLDVEFLCGEVGVSKTRLFTKIKSITGQSIVEFIRTFRLKRSVQIMTEEAVPLNEVAYRVGFQDPSYFSKVFKKEFGKSPTQFLESLRRK
jgi:DNA-binding response OmpR family regulator